MKSQPAVTRRKKGANSRDRTLIKRNLESAHGVGRIFVVKSGEELRENVDARLKAMKADFETIEFFWQKLLSDPTYNETKEYPTHANLARGWELREGVKDLVEYKTKMKRLKVLIDHFQPGYDYELTVDEVVEVLS